MTYSHVLHVDLETYSSADLSKCGVYKYTESPDFQILLCGYAIDNGPVQQIDLTNIDNTDVWQKFIGMVENPAYLKVAHNATFELACFRSIFTQVDTKDWLCTMALANYAGFPSSLANLSQALQLDDKSKLSTGVKLIAYFCRPDNKSGERHMPIDDPDGWKEFCRYNARDVEAERAVYDRLIEYNQPEREHDVYVLDNKINRRGIRIDIDLAQKAQKLSNQLTDKVVDQLKELTGLSNPNSVAQFKDYLRSKGHEVQSLTKTTAETLAADDTLSDDVRRAINLKLSISKASVKKYDSMLRAVCNDGRVRGMLQYYGTHTGRWAGRLVQLQNLRRNSLPDLDVARQLVMAEDLDGLNLAYDEYDISEILGQLVRTAFVPAEGKKFIVADYSAIEARVIAWLADESWREEVFAHDGDIYKSSYSQAFGVPVEDVTKEMRQKGKIMELALGYGGGVGAMKRFGADKLGLDDNELQALVDKWRTASPRIPELWRRVEACFCSAVKGRHTVLDKGVEFGRYHKAVGVKLPSGRMMCYQAMRIDDNNSLVYMDIKQTTGRWTEITTYGGKLVENIIQAIARDCLADAMLRLDAAGYAVVSHIHDEVIIEAEPGQSVAEAERIMGITPAWAAGLHLTAKGYSGDYYYKD